MSFEPTSHSIDRSMSLDRKVTRCKTRTVSESIYEDELIKNITTEIRHEVTNANPSSIYFPINVCLEEYNKYELCAYIDSGYSTYFGARSLFSKFI